MVIDTLLRAGEKGLQLIDIKLTSRCHHDPIGLIRYRYKCLAGERVPLHHAQRDRLHQGGRTKHIDQGSTAVFGNIDAGQIVIALSMTIVDGKMSGPIANFDHIAKGSECFAGQGFGLQYSRLYSTIWHQRDSVLELGRIRLMPRPRAYQTRAVATPHHRDRYSSECG